jgi:hypothetical protein
MDLYLRSSGLQPGPDAQSAQAVTADRLKRRGAIVWAKTPAQTVRIPTTQKHLNYSKDENQQKEITPNHQFFSILLGPTWYSFPVLGQLKFLLEFSVRWLLFKYRGF